MTDPCVRYDDVDDADLWPLVAKLSLERKVRLLTGADCWGLHDEPDLGLRRVVVSDGPSGIRGESWDDRDPALNLPSSTALGASWDTGLAYRYGAILAVEARRKGADVVLGPTINLHRSPLGGRHFEAYSEDPLLTSALAAAYVRGVQDGGVGACPKHYVANDFETERFTANVEVGERALRELYLAAFEDTVVRERPWMVMSAYNSVNGATMTENPLLTEPLCGEWGFDGVVVSDWWAAKSTEPSALARQDLIMPGPDGPWGEKLVEAVRTGRVPEEAVDEKVLRLLRLAARAGALDGFPAAVPEPAAPEDGRSLAREVAAAGMVLVRNAGELPWDSSAPGSLALIGHNAFLARTQGGGSAHVEPEHVVSPLDGLRAALPDTRITWNLGALVQSGIAPLPLQRLTDPVSGEPGVRAVFRAAGGADVINENRRTTNLSRLGSGRLCDTTTIEVTTRYVPQESGTVRLGVAGASQAEVAIVVVGTSAEVESEGFDRTTLALPGRQDDLVAAVAAVNPRTVVVVNAGAPVLMPWRDEVAAVLLTWFGGQEFGHALADVLRGVTEPGGRLPTTWPAAESDVPVLDTSPVDGVVRYDEGVHIGYRAWLRAGVEPAYPFGHGLGYTSWEFADLQATPGEDGVDVVLQLRNTGERAGKQVVQVYLSRQHSSVDRPHRWLAGFACVRAEPGELRTARISLPRRVFVHWDGSWQVEPGTYTVHAGFSVGDTPRGVEVTIVEPR